MLVRTCISVGEWIDKLTILELKLAALRDPERVANVRREYALATADGPSLERDDIARLRARLKAVNAELWRIEDDIRAKERLCAFDAEFIALARAVYITNDARAALKREINRVAGSELVEEKSYASA